MTRWKNQLEQNGESAVSLDDKTQEIKTEGTHQLSLDEHLEKLLQLSPEELGASGTDKGKGAGADSDLRAAILKQYQEVGVTKSFKLKPRVNLLNDLMHLFRLIAILMRRRGLQSLQPSWMDWIEIQMQNVF